VWHHLDVSSVASCVDQCVSGPGLSAALSEWGGVSVGGQHEGCVNDGTLCPHTQTVLGYVRGKGGSARASRVCCVPWAARAHQCSSGTPCAPGVAAVVACATQYDVEAEGREIDLCSM
jgi:hypothetical protein